MRQYIGARYVPKFMGTYDATQAYEALCVVDNGLGTSYISTVPTPAGTPLTDTDHWAIYGASSGAIISLQNQIDTINNTDLPALDNRLDNVEADIVTINDELDHLITTESERSLTGSEIMIVTDSFETSLFPGFDNIISGTVQLGAAGANYETMANMINTYAGDKTAIKSIIVIGGTNEHDESLINARFSAMKTAMAGYTNAKLYIAFIKSNFNSNAERALVNPLIVEIKKRCLQYGFVFLDNFNYTLFPTFAVVGSDGVHPTMSGGARIASAIFNKYANDVSGALVSCIATATFKGLTLTLICDAESNVSLYVSGTTNDTITTTWTSLGFDMSFYTAALTGSYIRCGLLKLREGGALNFGLANGALSVYYSAENSGHTSCASGEVITGQLIPMSLVGVMKYKITNS